ncbi:MAG: HEAT repeat domain-containing protein [Phycisphaerales bacterium]|nr:HEAT repeat domain-containing protein [Phycisphaerales bacterium]
MNEFLPWGLPMAPACRLPFHRSECCRCDAARIGLPRSAAARGAALLLSLCFVAASAADILHLATGGTVEGEIISRDEQNYVVRTTAGTITLPADAVTRVEVAPSPFQEYELRLAETRDTAEGQFALAEWCLERGLSAERRRHLQRAIELDGDFAPARSALGHLRVGEFWVDARTTVRRDRSARPEEEPRAEGDRNDERVVGAIQSNWIRRIRTIRTQQLESQLEKSRVAGRTSILEIRDPLAILPMTRVLSGGNRSTRELLVEALGSFAEDEATMNLAALVLVDGDRGVRERAVSRLKARSDPRVAPQMRRALRSDNDELIRRAAYVLGEIGDASAVPELIESLKVRRWKMVEVPMRGYFGEWQQVFTGQTITTISGQVQVAHNPQIGVFDAGFVTIQSELQRREVTVYRTEVLEALKLLTGENFGFEIPAWKRWLEEKRP